MDLWPTADLDLSQRGIARCPRIVGIGKKEKAVVDLLIV